MLCVFVQMKTTGFVAEVYSMLLNLNTFASSCSHKLQHLPLFQAHNVASAVRKVDVDLLSEKETSQISEKVPTVLSE